MTDPLQQETATAFLLFHTVICVEEYVETTEQILPQRAETQRQVHQQLVSADCVGVFFRCSFLLPTFFFLSFFLF